MQKQSVTVIAPAKLNLSLDVVGLLPNGYHDLDMVMQAITLREQLTLRRSDTMLCFSARRSSEAAPVSYYTAALEEVPACRLLCYLYENSIGPEQLRDVLSDFCGRTL